MQISIFSIVFSFFHSRITKTYRDFYIVSNYNLIIIERQEKRYVYEIMKEKHCIYTKYNIL